MPDAPALARELAVIDRARGGDHDAFVELYRQDAPPAWRLALALTADPDHAAGAVAHAFGRVLAPAREGEVRSEVPFRVRLLTATRLAVVDAGTSSPGADVTLVAADDDLGAPVRTTRAAEVLRAFHQLPERWRSMLWLLAVEGMAPTEAAGIVGVRPDDADELGMRANAGLRTQWTRDRVEAGEPEPVAPEHLERHLQTVLPLPLELFDVVEARWRDRQRQSRRRAAVAGLVLPGGRPLPRWAERGLIAGTTALIVLGITSAIAVDRDGDGRPDRRGRQLAGGTTPTTLSHAESSTLDAPGQAVLDTEEDDASGTWSPAVAAAHGRAATGTTASGSGTATPVTGASSGGATPATPGTAGPATDGPTTTTTPPVLQVNVGVGPALAVGLGDCTGVELGGQVLGCEPDPDTGVHLGGTLLGR